jgi:hypothetical protein
VAAGAGQSEYYLEVLPDQEGLDVHQAGNINGFQVRLQGVIVVKRPHSLHHIIPDVVIHLHIKAIQLVEKNREVFVKSFCQKYTMFQQRFCLPGFVQNGKFIQCHEAGKIASLFYVSNTEAKK